MEGLFAQLLVFILSHILLYLACCHVKKQGLKILCLLWLIDQEMGAKVN